jgi:hypothetical protein
MNASDMIHHREEGWICRSRSHSDQEVNPRGPRPPKLRITVIRRVPRCGPRTLLEGNIQHENRDQHRHEDPGRRCLQNSVPRQHLVEDQDGCDTAAKE